MLPKKFYPRARTRLDAIHDSSQNAPVFGSNYNKNGAKRKKPWTDFFLHLPKYKQMHGGETLRIGEKISEKAKSIDFRQCEDRLFKVCV